MVESLKPAATRFEENPQKNAELCIKLVDEHCVSCGAFHLRSILRRVTISPDRKTGDTEEFRAMIGLALTRLKQNLPQIRVVVVGSTDTGILATLLTTAHQLWGQAGQSSLQVTLLDQCATPLKICEAYAKKAGVSLEVVQTDVIAYAPDASFDLILMHGVLPFFPRALQPDYMTRIASWLSRDGALISSTHLGAQPDPLTAQKRTHQAIENLATFKGPDGPLDPDTLARLTKQLTDSLAQRAGEPHVFRDLEEATGFYRAVGLGVSSFWVVNHSRKDDKAHRKYKSRGLALCTSLGV